MNVDPELTLSDNQPDNYYFAKEGLYGIDRAEEPRLTITGYIIPVDLAANKSQDSGLSVVLHCQTTNGMISQEIVLVARVSLRSEVVCCHFVGKGPIPICSMTSVNAYSRAAAGLSLKRYRPVNKCGWQPGDLCFMRGRHVIKSEKITEVHGMIPAASYNPSPGIDARGSLDEWKEKVLKHTIDDMQKLAAWVGLSSCLPSLLNEQGIIYHFYRESSVGKTALLQLAASMNGNGGEPGSGESFIESRNTAPSTPETTLEQRNYITTPTDELGMYKGLRIGDAIYVSMNGRDKQRMSSETLKDMGPASWLLNIISSGEVSMQERLRGGGGAVRGRLLHRSIDLLVTSEYVQSYKDESSEDCGRCINMIKVSSAQFYGTAGRAFIEGLVNLTDDESEMCNYVKDVYQYASGTLVYRYELRGDQLDTVQKWLLKCFAVPGTAALLAYNSGILERGEDEVLATLMTAFDVWVADVQPEIDPMQGALLDL